MVFSVWDCVGDGALLLSVQFLGEASILDALEIPIYCTFEQKYEGRLKMQVVHQIPGRSTLISGRRCSRPPEAHVNRRACDWTVIDSLNPLSIEQSSAPRQ
jgi:hypothetical protein